MDHAEEIRATWRTGHWKLPRGRKIVKTEMGYNQKKQYFALGEFQKMRKRHKIYFKQ